MDALGMMFDHHKWATLALIDHYSALPPDVQAATVPGTHGSIKATLVHLVAAEQRYLAYVLGEPVAARRVHERNEIRIDELRAPFEVQADRGRWALVYLDHLDVTLPAEGG